MRRKLTNRLLLVFMIAILISGIQLEITGEGGEWSVITHIIIGCGFVALCFYHIYNHFGRKNWFAIFRKLKSQFTRVLWWVFILMTLSAVVATIHWVIEPQHSVIGAVHGKIGFLMIILAVCHFLRRIKRL